MNTIHLTIAGHTNAGKTALARTLLCRDVGEVHDAPHITQTVETYDWVKTSGWTLRLTDTPGFDGVPRLLRRFRQSGKLSGWFAREVWDRTTDRSFYHTQRAFQEVMSESDVVLYVVDTASEFAGPGPVTRSEFELLTLLGKPTIVVLNQTGRAWTHAESAATEDRWRSALREILGVREVTTLDAFTRCWPCELLLFDHLAKALPEEKRQGARELRQALWEQHQDVFKRSMHAVAETIASMSEDSEPSGKGGVLRNARRVVAQLVAGSADRRALEEIHERMKHRMGERYTDLVNRLIVLHGIRGESSPNAVGVVATDFDGSAASRLKWTDLAAAAAGGAGAGGAIDVVVGGASFGAGLAIGAVFGTLAAFGLGMRDLAQRDDGEICWRTDAVVRHLGTCLRSYLAVAHYGRGQGAWRDYEGPDYWKGVVDTAVRSRGTAASESVELGAEPLKTFCLSVGEEVLRTLYPTALGNREALSPIRK